MNEPHSSICAQYQTQPASTVGTTLITLVLASKREHTNLLPQTITAMHTFYFIVLTPEPNNGDGMVMLAVGRGGGKVAANTLISGLMQEGGAVAVSNHFSKSALPHLCS